MPATDIVFIAELRNKVEQLVQSGMSKKEAIIVCDSECNYRDQNTYIYRYRKFLIEISAETFSTGIEINAENICWNSNIHFENQTVVTIGAFKTRLEAALMAEKMINQWY